jgi:hypothetical protein
VCQGGVCFNPDGASDARAYTEGNVSGDFLDIDLDDVGTENAPFPAAPVTTDDACTAARLVLEGAGARPLDSIDVQYLAPVTLPICRRTTTTLTAPDSPTPHGASVTITATIQPRPPAVGIPEGSVTFSRGSVAMSTVPLVGGVATLITAALPEGTSTVKAIYSGDPDFDGSQASLKHSVIGSPTSTALLALANPSHLGVPVTLTATVTVLPPSIATAEGSVRFYDGTKLLGTRPLVGGVATLASSALPAGFRTMKAQYLGDSGFAKSTSLALALRIDGGTVTSLTRSPSAADTGQLVRFTARVSPLTVGVPTGTVTFRDGGALLGTLPLVGKHPVTASYDGNASFEPSVSPAASTNIVKGGSKTTLTSSVLSLLLHQVVKFTAVVTPLAPATGAPAGTLKFKDGSTILATVNLSGGTAEFSTINLGLGAHSIFGMYSGSAEFQSSSSKKITVTVTPSP